MIYTDENGVFMLNNTDRFNPYPISIAKENYTDTSFLIYKPGEKSLTIYLHPFKKPLAQPLAANSLEDAPLLVQTDTIQNSPFAFLSDYWDRVKLKNNNFRNIRDTLFSEFNVSFIPCVSTNHLLDINTVNKYSFNILGGVSKGVDLFELGGLFNYDLGNMRYVQIGGLANYVEGKVEGTQVGGLFNVNRHATNGVQLGGLFNLNLGSLNGVQMVAIWI